jgi:hypothetical protein
MTTMTSMACIRRRMMYASIDGDNWPDRPSS